MTDVLPVIRRRGNSPLLFDIGGEQSWNDCVKCYIKYVENYRIAGLPVKFIAPTIQPGTEGAEKVI